MGDAHYQKGIGTSFGGHTNDRYGEKKSSRREHSYVYMHANSCLPLIGVLISWQFLMQFKKNVRGTLWECNECGKTWVHEWDGSLATDDIDEFGYCYEGLHDKPRSEESDPQSD